MTALPKILRVNRTDERSKHMLLNVTKHGSGELDLTIVGTDQESLFRGNIKDSNVQAVQAAHFEGNTADLRLIIAYALLHERPQGSLPDVLQGVEAVSSISRSTATIQFRRNVGGIRQKLGELNLEEFEDDIDTFEWIKAAVLDADGLRSEMDVLQASLTCHRDQVAKLTSQLDELVQAKKAHEEQLLSKFAALLNTKKLKIRDQERLLRDGVQINAAVAADVSQARAFKRGETERVGASRGKRKAESTAVVSEGESDVDSQEIDTASEEEDRRRQDTPETEGEDDMEVDELPSPPQQALPSRETKAVKSTPPATTRRDESEEETEDEL